MIPKECKRQKGVDLCDRFGLCMWRLGRFDEAERIFDRMLWLNPSDNLGVRFLIDEVRAKTAWEDRREQR